MFLSAQKKPILFRTFLFYVFLLAFLSRFCIGLFIANNILHSEYVILARNLIHGNGLSFGGMYPTAWRTPMYPLVFAVWMKLFGETKLALIILNCLTGAINVVLCALLTRKIFGKTAGVISAYLYALTPYLAQKEIVSESAWISLGLMAGLYLLLEAKKHYRIFNVTAAGFLFSFTYLTRPTVGLIPFFVLICLLIKSYQKKKIRYLGYAIVFIGAFSCGILPWAMRNKSTLGYFYFSQTNSWYNFYIGNHRNTFDLYPQKSLDNFCALYPYKEKLPNNEFEREKWHFRAAKEEVRFVGTGGMLSASLKKLFFLWSIRMTPYLKRTEDPLTHQPSDRERSVTENLIFSIPYLFIVCFAFLGCWQIHRRMSQLLVFSAGFLLAFSLPYMLTFAYSRYAVPAYFILIILAAKGITSLIRSLTI